MFARPPPLRPRLGYARRLRPRCHAPHRKKLMEKIWFGGLLYGCQPPVNYPQLLIEKPISSLWFVPVCAGCGLVSLIIRDTGRSYAELQAASAPNARRPGEEVLANERTINARGAGLHRCLAAFVLDLLGLLCGFCRHRGLCPGVAYVIELHGQRGGYGCHGARHRLRAYRSSVVSHGKRHQGRDAVGAFWLYCAAHRRRYLAKPCFAYCGRRAHGRVLRHHGPAVGARVPPREPQKLHLQLSGAHGHGCGHLHDGYVFAALGALYGGCCLARGLRVHVSLGAPGAVSHRCGRGRPQG